MVSALSLIAFGDKRRKLNLYDTFTGMTKPTIKDSLVSNNTEKALNFWNENNVDDINFWCKSSLKEVKGNLKITKYPNENLKYIKGDVREKNAWLKALKGVDYIYHMAAYQDYLPDFSKFFDVNDVGTALMYEIIVAKKFPVKKVY